MEITESQAPFQISIDFPSTFLRFIPIFQTHPSYINSSKETFTSHEESFFNEEEKIFFKPYPSHH